MNTTEHPGGRAWRARAVAACAPLLPLLLAAQAAAAPPLPPKNINTTGNMAFGRFAAVGGGSVTIGIDGARTRVGTVVLLPSAAAAAAFSVGSNNNGNDNKVYVLTLPANGSVSLASGPNRMPVNYFSSSFRPGSPLPSGVQTITVGATLQVASQQAPGSYSGNFNVTLEYQ